VYDESARVGSGHELDSAHEEQQRCRVIGHAVVGPRRELELLHFAPLAASLLHATRIVVIGKAPFTRYNLLSNRLSNQFDNTLYRVHKYSTGCQTRSTTGLTTGWMFVYTIQPVVKPVVQPVVSCKWGTTFTVVTIRTYWSVDTTGGRSHFQG